jgi:4-hydroxyphenylacetate 3-monooxygenase
MAQCAPHRSIARGKRARSGLLTSDQSPPTSGGVLASSQRHDVMHNAHALRARQIYITPEGATLRDPETASFLEERHSLNENGLAEDRCSRPVRARLPVSYHRASGMLSATSPHGTGAQRRGYLTTR